MWRQDWSCGEAVAGMKWRQWSRKAEQRKACRKLIALKKNILSHYFSLDFCLNGI